MTEGEPKAEGLTVPDGWQAAPLRKFGDFKSGNGFPLKYQGKQSGEIPFYKVSDMSGEGNSMLMTNANHWIAENTRRILGAHIMPPNAIIFAKIGAAIFLERRRVLSMNSCIDNNLMSFLPSATESDPLFFYYVLQSIPFGPLVAATALPSLSGKTIGALSFCVPPLHEQNRIATALKDIDDLIASLDALIAKKRDIKQAAMQQLLTGKTRLAGFEGEWKIYSFATLFTFLRSGSYSRSDLSVEGDVSYVHYGDIHACASPRMSAIELPKIAAAKVCGLPRVKNGDLIFADASEDYAGVGKSVEMVDCNDREVVAGLHTILARGNADLLADGFKGYIQMLPDVKAALIRIANGISVYGISKTGMQRIQILLPSKEEQSAIATVLMDIDAELDELAAKRSKIVQIGDGMRQELLTGRIRLV